MVESDGLKAGREEVVRRRGRKIILIGQKKAGEDSLWNCVKEEMEEKNCNLAEGDSGKANKINVEEG